MRVIDPGHLYELANLDAPPRSCGTLRFVKRLGDKYPGNEPPSYPGTTTQEVIRALIDRQHYVNGQRPDASNAQAISALRQALRVLEMRAARERGDFSAMIKIHGMDAPETEPICDNCGHLLCQRDHKE